MLRLPYRPTLSLGLVTVFALAAGCGQPEIPEPTEYVKFKYSVNPGTSTGDKPLVLTVSPAPVAMGKTCFRTQNQIYLYASAPPATALITLTGATATAPNQVNLQANTQTVGSVEVELDIPTAMDELGNFTGPVSFKTSTPGNALTCFLNLGGPDLFSVFDGNFTCSSLSTAPGRKLTLTEGQFHAVPCPAGG